jgi:hypothetical protein
MIALQVVDRPTPLRRDQIEAAAAFGVGTISDNAEVT